MTAEPQTADGAQNPWNAIETMSTRRLFRLYFERLWYSVRGLFAFPAAILFDTDMMARSGVATETVVATSVDQFIIQHFSRGLLVGLGVGLAVLNGVLATAVLLAFIDLYEAEVATIVDVDD